MSCHNIGKGLNQVVKKIVTLYDNNEITKKVAIELISTARKAIYWCDGNEYEAVDCVRECRCGRCLKKMGTGEKLYSVWDVSDDVIQKYKIMDNSPELLAFPEMCTECFDIVVNRHTGNKDSGAKERKYIEDQELVCICE